MTGALLVLTGLQIVITTSINLWIESLFDSLETRDTRRFLLLAGAAALIVLANIVVTIAHLTVKRWLQIGWREWLTHRLLGEWMTGGLHYKVTLFPGEHTNPDGRIAEDVRFTTENALELGHSLLYATLILFSFATILWELSGAPVIGFGKFSFSVPGHLVWIAVLYAAIGTFVALRLGLPLIRAQNLRQTTEADFRFGLARVRENSLQVALLRGEPSENHTLRALFREAIRSWKHRPGRGNSLAVVRATRLPADRTFLHRHLRRSGGESDLRNGQNCCERGRESDEILAHGNLHKTCNW